MATGGMEQAIVDAVEVALSRIESDDDVAYAEVGGVDASRIDAVVTERGKRSATVVSTAGVWCRVFADGTAGYHYCDSLAAEDVEDAVERATRGARQRAHERDARYDAHSIHRDDHGGWAAPDDQFDAIEPETAIDRFVDAVEGAIADRQVSRARVRLRVDPVETTVATSTGGAVRTRLDRVGVDATFDGEETGVRRHAGSTAGAALLAELPERVAAWLTELERRDGMERADDAPTGDDVRALLSPAASAQLAIACSRWFTADSRYAGTAPVDVGDRIGPPSLTIHDVVRPGSWAARAYDAQARPTQPVTIVDDGDLATLLHSTATAADRNAQPAGNLVPGLSAENAPRIAPRHLGIEPGDAAPDDLAADAVVRIDRFGEPRPPDPVLDKHRTSWVPPDPIAAEATRDELRAHVGADAPGRLDVPVAEGVRLRDGEAAGRLEDVTVAFDLDHLQTVSGIGAVRETITAVDAKHKTRIPVASTAPALSLSTTLRT